MQIKGRSIVMTASAASLLQLLLIICSIPVIAIVGIRPETAMEAYETFGQNMLLGLLRDDLLLVIMIALYLVTFTALFIILKEHRYDLSLMATILTFAAVIITLSTHSGFSLMFLSERYHQAIDDSTRSQLIAAGEAIIASNMWHSTSSYFSGIMLQGSAVLISIAMMGHGSFRKLTIISGIVANGLDLLQHIVHPVLPSLAEIVLYIAGPLYIIWYIVLAIDLYKHAKQMTSKDGSI